MRWAQPGFDDSRWKRLDLEDQGQAKPGWIWFRKHVRVGPEYSNVRLLVEGAEGNYELYVNGVRMEGAQFRSQFNLRRPIERVFTLESESGDFLLALRTHTPRSYAVYGLPLFLSVTMGGQTAIGYEQEALESERLYTLEPSVAINMLLILAGLAALALFSIERTQREYLHLGIYLFLLGLSNGTWYPQGAGLLPTSANLLFADPLIYIYTIAQIEFTYSFARRRVGRGWRIYQVLLVASVSLAALCFAGIFPSDVYVLVEAALAAPVGLLLTVLLFVWYRKGNREAAWLILPSLLPAVLMALYDLGTASILFGWQRLDFLDNSIPIGVFQLHIPDAGNLVFLLAIFVVMFFRFSRVSQERAQTAAELDAAREVQERLVRPPREIPGFRIETAYIPAAQVGGDFYFVRADSAGGLNIVVGDVSGKGLRAAMTVAAIIGALRTLPPFMPSGLLTGMNQSMVGEMRGGFVTCCALHVTADGKVTIANAGHLAPYLDGVEVDCGFALPMGLAMESEYAERAIELKPGEKLTLLSDGVVEARNALGELYGFERTAAISGQSAEEIALTAQRFGQEDDITVLTLCRVALAADPQSAA
jgi:hypothetical protein